MTIALGLLLAAAPVASCAPQDATAPATAPTTADCKDVSKPNWRAVADDDDRERMRNWRKTWVAALEEARQGTMAREIDSGGALFDPDRALPNPLPPAGAYLCRTYKLGAKPPATAQYRVYAQQECQVNPDGDLLRLVVVGGPQRAIGHIYADTNARGVFLGTLQLGDEPSVMEYGQDHQRDLAGFVDHVGERRWRIILPEPAFESRFDVIELLPAR